MFKFVYETLPIRSSEGFRSQMKSRSATPAETDEAYTARINAVLGALNLGSMKTEKRPRSKGKNTNKYFQLRETYENGTKRSKSAQIPTRFSKWDHAGTGAMRHALF